MEVTAVPSRTLDAPAKAADASGAKTTSRAGRTMMVYLPPELIRELRVYAAVENKTMSAVTAAALQAYFADHPLPALRSIRRR